jgi:hypothetical protein
MRRSRLYITTIIPGLIAVFFIGAMVNAHSSAFPCKEYYTQETVDSADIVINKYIEAIGGKEKLESIRTIYMEGTLNIRGQKAISKTWIINNKESRNESTINGFTNWSIVRNDSAWSYNPRRGQKFPEPWPADRIKTSQSGLDIQGTLVDYKKKGYTIEYKGIDQIEGSDVFKIEEKLNESVTKTFYIDLDSYLIIRVRTKSTTKNRVNYSNTDYSNYQKTKDGYMFPMQMAELKYTIVTVNPDINEALFIPKK